MIVSFQVKLLSHSHDNVVNDIRGNLLLGRGTLWIGSLNLQRHFNATHNMPEQVIFRLQSRCIISGTDEELAAIGIRTGVCHCQTTLGICRFDRLIFELITRATGTSTQRVACLSDKTGYYTMEFEAIIKLVLCQEDKVVDRQWRQ